MADEVARKLYHWEDAFVATKQRPGDMLLTSEQCRLLVEQACTVTGTRLPTVRFRNAAHVPCKANFRTWEIILAEWGRAALPVLHEVGHLATFDDVMAGENPHGPSFARMVIELYATFMGVDMEYMLRTAARCGVVVGPHRGRIGLPSNESPFGDEIF